MGKKARKKRETNKKQRVANNEAINKPEILPEGTRFSIGDSVVVKKGTLDPDYGNDISGWQGRIYAIDDSNHDDPLISIEWDSITLKNMPHSLIEDSEKDGLVWSMMALYARDLKPAKPRDREEEVTEALEMISEKYDLEEFDDGDSGSIEDEIETDQQIKRVQAILEVTDEEDMVVDDENLKKYFHYLNENIGFPCIVTGIEDFRWEEFYVLGPGDQKEYEKLKKTRPSYTDEYKILSIDGYDLDYGILVNVRRISDRKKFTLPLEDLEAVDKKSNNYQILDDYSVWFVNYR